SSSTGRSRSGGAATPRPPRARRKWSGARAPPQEGTDEDPQARDGGRGDPGGRRGPPREAAPQGGGGGGHREPVRGSLRGRPAGAGQDRRGAGRPAGAARGDGPRGAGALLRQGRHRGRGRRVRARRRHPASHPRHSVPGPGARGQGHHPVGQEAGRARDHDRRAAPLQGRRVRPHPLRRDGGAPERRAPRRRDPGRPRRHRRWPPPPPHRRPHRRRRQEGRWSSVGAKGAKRPNRSAKRIATTRSKKRSPASSTTNRSKKRSPGSDTPARSKKRSVSVTTPTRPEARGGRSAKTPLSNALGIKFGLRLPSFALGPRTATLAQMGAYLRRAEDLGFDSAVSIDHLLLTPPAYACT